MNSNKCKQHPETIMYSSSIGPLKPPTKFNTFKEIRAPLEWLFAYGNRRKLAHVPRGDGRILVLVPGYGADEWSMRPLKKFLKSINYQVFDWGHGRNRGHVKHDTGLLAETVKTISERHNQAAVTLVGWSLGGILSREVARLHPKLVREVLTMGTPVTLEIKGTVRLARGFTSKTYTVERPFSLMITIWTFINPLIPRASPILVV